MDTPQSRPGDLRLGDADRLHALNALGDHFAAGRLRDEEFTELSGRAADARLLSELEPLFAGLPGGSPLTSRDGFIVQRTLESTGAPTANLPAAVDTHSAELVERSSDKAELESLRHRGKLINTLDSVIVGVTLVAFLVLMFVLHWPWAWIVWPSLALTLSVPRLILGYSDEDEEVYDEIKEADDAARKKRLKRAAQRINELEERREHGDGPQ